MKDIGSYVGSLGVAYGTWGQLGNLDSFEIWQKLLIWCFILLCAMVGGFVAIGIQHSIVNISKEVKKIYAKWNGKKKQLTFYS